MSRSRLFAALTVITTAICCAAAPLRSWAAAPWAGLPERIPADFIEQKNMLPFEEEASPRAPIGVRLTINGVPTLSPEKWGEAFLEDFYASIPAGKKIGVTKDSKDREVWNYPIDTWVVHRIRFNTKNRPVFEFRVVNLQPSGIWAMGVYSPSTMDPDAPPSELLLNTYAGTPDGSYRMTSAESGRALDIQLKRLPLQSCKNCHFNASPSNYMYETPDQVGPCGFAPHNPSVKGGWAEAWQKKNGVSAF